MTSCILYRLITFIFAEYRRRGIVRGDLKSEQEFLIPNAIKVPILTFLKFELLLLQS